MFLELLKRAGITKAELSRRIGTTKSGISKWGERPPKYAIAYLELLIEFNRIRP